MKRNFSNKYEKIIERITYTFNYYICCIVLWQYGWRTFVNSAMGWFMLGQYFAIMRTISCIVRVNGTGWLSHITLLINVTHDDVEQPGVGTSYGHVFHANSLTQ